MVKFQIQCKFGVSVTCTSLNKLLPPTLTITTPSSKTPPLIISFRILAASLNTNPSTPPFLQRQPADSNNNNQPSQPPLNSHTNTEPTPTPPASLAAPAATNLPHQQATQPTTQPPHNSTTTLLTKSTTTPPPSSTFFSTISTTFPPPTIINWPALLPIHRISNQACTRSPLTPPIKTSNRSPSTATSHLTQQQLHQ